MKPPYLIQRCTFKNVNREQATGFDAVASCDYMGSSEFEFGALPNSLKAITKELEKYNIFKTPLKNVDGEGLWLLCKEEDKEEITKILLVLSKDNQREYYLKERCELERSLKTSGSAKDSYRYINLWWDLDNHWMAGFQKEKMELLLVGLRNLQSRWKVAGKI